MSVTSKTELIPELTPEIAPEAETSLRRFISDFMENKVAVGALAIFISIVIVAIFAPLISPQNPYDLAEIDIMDSRLPPGSESLSGKPFLLGTDDQGRWVPHVQKVRLAVRESLSGDVDEYRLVETAEDAC